MWRNPLFVYICVLTRGSAHVVASISSGSFFLDLVGASAHLFAIAVLAFHVMADVRMSVFRCSRHGLMD